MSIKPTEIKFNEPFDATFGDKGIFDVYTNAKGIRFFHFAAIPDPLHNKSLGDIRTSYNQEEDYQFDTANRHRENGFIYYLKGVVKGIFTGNNKNQTQLASGLYGASGATVSISRHYEDGKKVHMTEYDKLIPCDATRENYSTNWEKFTHNPTGVDRLQFKALEVDTLIDADGRLYVQGEHFQVVNGNIQWIQGQEWPGTEQMVGRGKICSVRYTYKPYYYVKMVYHDVRLIPVLDPLQQPTVEAAPLLVSVQADWVFLDVRNKEADEPAAQLESGTGENMGPR